MNRVPGGPMADALRALPESWRQQAAALEHFGAPSNATCLRAAADELEAALRAQNGALLTIAEAACQSGLSADHIGRLLRSGRIPNAGRKGAPRIRQGDLPRKARATLPAAGPEAYDPNADARRLLGRLQQGDDAA